jgi:hypothetical protein
MVGAFFVALVGSTLVANFVSIVLSILVWILGPILFPLMFRPSIFVSLPAAS